MKFNKHLETIKTYEGGKPIELVVREFGIKPEDVVKLASNENPNGCSPMVQKAVVDIVANMSMYPDDSMGKLKIGLAQRFDVKENNIIIGAGSDQIIALAIYAKTNKSSKILTNGVTFAMYDVYAKHIGCEIIKTTSTDTHDLEQFYTLYKEHKPEIIFLCTPNNPTGDAIDVKEMLEFIDKIDKETLVIVDGAYMEYAKAKDKSKAVEPKDLVRRYENVLYLGTFSKAYGLGGMRIGYGIANTNIINQLYKLRPPFNITTLSLEAASEALKDEEFVKNSISMNFDEMKRYEDFARSEKIDIITSYTNFVTLVLNERQNSTKISDSLLRLGMIVRDLSGYGMNAIRVTVGKHEQNTRFFNLVTKFL